ncbi:uncharacterized protein LOC117791954 [Drosophila innubila]|uniref:uncharacterized protein LOC117791954 n=1 Tax=Drosophila innubila TaxID=198719 RepID=UPI00148E00B6|nr:uncharacterized protein LOC117791954 [Drosophila innubila]
MQFIWLLLIGALGCCAAAPRGYYDYDYSRRRSPSSGYNYNTQSSRYSRQSSNKSDQENAKFAGAQNQELDDLNGNAGDTRTLLLKKKLKKLYRPYAAAAASSYGYGRPCIPFGRDAGGQKDPVEQGRFLFDLNVYNVYPGGGGGGCRGYGGFGGGGLGGLGGLGGGLLSDPIAPVAPLPVPVPVRPYAPFATWLSLFAPGILQNSLAATVPLSDPFPLRPASAANDLQSDPAVDPNYNPTPVRRPVPNRVYYDSAGAPPVTPAQLVGGVATTVNGIIQQLTGQVQPVYQTGAYRSRDHRSSYG